MSWTAPRTWVAGELVTAAIMNSAVRDNLNVIRANIADDSTFKVMKLIPQVTLSLADNANTAITTTGLELQGFLFVESDEDNAGALFYVRGAGGLTYLLQDSLTLFSVTATTAGHVNVYYDGGTTTYRIENKRGGTRTFTMTYIGQLAG